MFTGIIEECGLLTKVEDLVDARRLTIAGPLVTTDAAIGDSIAVNGVCLSIVELSDSDFTVDVMVETLQCSSLGKLSIGQRVNLERALSTHSRLNGHLVQGHIDTTAEIAAIDKQPHWSRYKFQIDPWYMRYIVSKGSIAIDGVSLTVVVVSENIFTVSLIPLTLKSTIFSEKTIGDIVNIEVDMMAKYIEKLGGFASVKS